jgi:hypothetical protein
MNEQRIIKKHSEPSLFSTGLDHDCKKWRLFADILNDVALLTELLTPRQLDYPCKCFFLLPLKICERFASRSLLRRLKPGHCEI